MPTPFWVGGPDAYAKGLGQNYRATLKELRERRAQCVTDDERQALDQQIAQHQRELQEKLKSTDRLLF